MDRTYWLGRKRAAMAMARAAATSEARLIHYDMAGRYSIKAAASLPFLLADKGPATAGELAALHMPGAARPRSAFDFGTRPRPSPSPRPRRKGPAEHGE